MIGNNYPPFNQFVGEVSLLAESGDIRIRQTMNLIKKDLTGLPKKEQITDLVHEVIEKQIVLFTQAVDNLYQTKYKITNDAERITTLMDDIVGRHLTTFRNVLAIKCRAFLESTATEMPRRRR